MNCPRALLDCLTRAIFGPEGMGCAHRRRRGCAPPARCRRACSRALRHARPRSGLLAAGKSARPRFAPVRVLYVGL